MFDCLCLKCKKRFVCDFALSVWAAKARALDHGLDVEFITTQCNDFGDPFNMSD